MDETSKECVRCSQAAELWRGTCCPRNSKWNFVSNVCEAFPFTTYCQKVDAKTGFCLEPSTSAYRSTWPYAVALGSRIVDGLAVVIDASDNCAKYFQGVCVECKPNFYLNVYHHPHVLCCPPNSIVENGQCVPSVQAYCA